MNSEQLNVLLADDDADDRVFFKAALGELNVFTNLTTVHDGEQLMELLTDEAYELPHVLYLDLNMPRKNGFECLLEIKLNNKLKDLPVIIFSTSFEEEVVNLLYKNGARYFIRKPAEFKQFREVIQKSLELIKHKNISQPVRESFMLSIITN